MSTLEQQELAKYLTPSLTADEKISALFKKALDGSETINYIVTGDSTRGGMTDAAGAYYPKILGQLNVNVINNHAGGVDSQEWLDDFEANAGVTSCIAAIPGTGSTSIVEYSLGINDKVANTSNAVVISRITTGLNALLTAKPELTIILAEPVFFNSTYSPELTIVYDTISANFGLKLIKTTALMKTHHPVFKTDQPQYYIDYIHPNDTGHRRMINIIMNSVIPDKYKSLITIPEFIPEIADVSNTELIVTVEAGNYDASTGEPVVSAWQRAAPFAVEEGKELELITTGNQVRIAFFNAQGLVLLGSFRSEALFPKLLFPVPRGATEARVTLHNNATSITASIKYSAVPRIRPSVDVLSEDVGMSFFKKASALTSAQAKTLYENNPDTNPFRDADKTKLAGLSNGGGGATVDLAVVGGGTATSGSQLKATLSTGFESDGFQFTRDDVDITGATGSDTYTLTTDDNATTIKARTINLSSLSTGQLIDGQAVAFIDLSTNLTHQPGNSAGTNWDVIDVLSPTSLRLFQDPVENAYPRGFVVIPDLAPGATATLTFVGKLTPPSVTTDKISPIVKTDTGATGNGAGELTVISSFSVTGSASFSSFSIVFKNETAVTKSGYVSGWYGNNISSPEGVEFFLKDVLIVLS